MNYEKGSLFWFTIIFDYGFYFQSFMFAVHDKILSYR
jgi:hypothetical protein